MKKNMKNEALAMDKDESEQASRMILDKVSILEFLSEIIDDQTIEERPLSATSKIGFAIILKNISSELCEIVYEVGKLEELKKGGTDEK